MPRFYCPLPLPLNTALALPAAAARHVQVLRMQPGETLTLFNGAGGEYSATVLRMGRSEVLVQVQAHHPVERENLRPVHLALGVPANDRMDWLVEKATELGVTSIQPLMTAHSVLRLKGERADKKVAHWNSVAAAACEQCGRNRVPAVHAVLDLHDWLRHATAPPAPGLRAMLSLREGTLALAPWLAAQPPDASAPVWFFSGPEGGLAAAEEQAALDAGWAPVTLGLRTLRAETAPLAALAALTAFGPR